MGQRISSVWVVVVVEENLKRSICTAGLVAYLEWFRGFLPLCA